MDHSNHGVMTKTENISDSQPDQSTGGHAGSFHTNYGFTVFVDVWNIQGAPGWF